jgi:hypothetical protein
MKRVVVLGCGPAGLLAAHAASHEMRLDVRIISVKEPSKLFGCQYLHEPIPGLFGLTQRSVNYVLRGTPEEYARKVYGDIRVPSVSPQQFLGERPAWDIRAAYEQLWERYESRIEHGVVWGLDIDGIKQSLSPDAIISSIPADALCNNEIPHSFTKVSCWAIGDAPELGQIVPIPTTPFTVVCDGTSEVGYYRAANVFDHATVEWPGSRKKPPISGVVAFAKPLSTNCDCNPDVHRVGRNGLWCKGVLAHHAYASTRNHLTAIMNRGSA